VAFFNTQSKKRGFCFASFSNHLSDWKMAVLSALRFPAALESQGRPSVAGPLGGRKVHRTFL